MRVMNAQDTPNGTRMMWKASVKAICERAHGTGSAVAIATTTWVAVFTTTWTPPGRTDHRPGVGAGDLPRVSRQVRYRHHPVRARFGDASPRRAASPLSGRRGGRRRAWGR